MAEPAGDRILGAALASSRLPTKVAFATRAVINGFWLGLLSDDSLRALDERYYAEQDMYRTPEWNERGLFAWEAELIEAHFPPAGRIAVLAAGGGREVLALRGRGYDAVGYESHPALVEFGGRFLADHGHPDALRSAPRDGFPSDAGSFAAVVFGWGAYSLVHGRDRRHALLVATRRLLEPSGPVLLSYFQRPNDHREARWTNALANALRSARRSDRIELGDTLSPNRLHAFTAAELAAEADGAGFETVTQRVVEPIEATTSYAAAVVAARP